MTIIRYSPHGATDGEWGSAPNHVLYNHACFAAYTAHWIVGVNGKWECDDYDGFEVPPKVSPNDV